MFNRKANEKKNTKKALAAIIAAAAIVCSISPVFAAQANTEVAMQAVETVVEENVEATNKAITMDKQSFAETSTAYSMVANEIEP